MKDFLTDEEMALEEAKANAPDFLTDEEMAKLEQPKTTTLPSELPQVKAPEPITIEEYQQPGNLATDAVRAATQLGAGVVGFGTEIGAGLNKFAGAAGLSNIPEGDAVKDTIQNTLQNVVDKTENYYAGKEPAPRSYSDGRTLEDTIEEAKANRKEFLGQDKTWWENFKSKAKEMGGEELKSAGEGLVNFMTQGPKNIYNAASGDPETMERLKDNPVLFAAETALPFAAGYGMYRGGKKMLSKEITKTPEPIMPNPKTKELLDQWLGKEEAPLEKPSGNTPPLKDVAPEGINSPEVKQPPASEPVIKETQNIAGPSMFGGAQIQNWWDKLANSEIGKKVEQGVKNFIADEEGSFDPNALKEAIQSVKERFKGSIKRGQSTQVSNTINTYGKILDRIHTLSNGKTDKIKIVDVSTGLGMSKSLAEDLGYKNYETTEPFPAEGFIPTFKDSSELKDNSYDFITNNQVLNVVEKPIRDKIVLDIGRALKPGGTAIISTRGDDVLKTKSKAFGSEPMSVYIPATDSKGNKYMQYQKGFTKNELLEYVSNLLGKDFTIKKVDFGKAGIEITKNDNSLKIGKKIGNDVYIHRSQIESLSPEIKEKINNNISRLPGDFEPTVIRYNTKDGTMSFMESKSFDSVSEPTVDRSILVDANGNISQPRKGSTVYHRKYEMVPENYQGFDIQKNKERVAKYEEKLKEQGVPKNKIGSSSFWNKWIKDFMANEEGSLNINKDIEEMFNRASETVKKSIEDSKEKPGIISKIKEQGFYGFEPVGRWLKKQGWNEKQIADINETYEQALYSDSLVNAVKEEALPKIKEAFARGGVDNVELNKFALLWRIAEGERMKYDPKLKTYMEVENPLNITANDARQRLALYTPEQLTALKDAFNTYEDARQPIIDEVINSGTFSPEQNEALKTNKAYSTNKVAEYMAKTAGLGEPDGKIFEMKGSTKDVLAVHDQKLIKDQQMLKFAKRQKMRAETINALSGTDAVSPTPKANYAPVKYMQGGEYKQVYMPESIAEVLTQPEGGYNMQAAAAKLLGFTIGGKEINLGKPLNAITNTAKRIYTSTPAFIASNSLIKDPLTNMRNLPGIKAPASYLMQYLQDLYLSATGKNEAVKKEIGQQYGFNRKRYSTDEAYAEPKSDFEKENIVKKYVDDITGIDNISKISLYKTLKKYQKEMNMSDAEIMQWVRMGGTPSTLIGGKFKKPLDFAFMFGNAAAQGYRFEAAGFKKDPWGWTLKTAAIPTMMAGTIYAAQKGYLGDKLKELYSALPSYVKGNYLSLPVRKNNKGKLDVITVPMDRSSALVLKTVMDAAQNDNDFGEGLLGLMSRAGYGIDLISGTFSDEAPPLTPGFAAASALYKYSKDEPIVDPFRKQEILTKDIMKSDETVKNYITGKQRKGNYLRKDLAFAAYLANQITGGIFKFDTDYKNRNAKEDKTPDWYSKLTFNPATKFYREVNTSEPEKMAKVRGKAEGENARDHLNIDEFINSGVEREGLAESIAYNSGYFKNQMMRKAAGNDPDFIKALTLRTRDKRLKDAIMEALTKGE